MQDQETTIHEATVVEVAERILEEAVRREASDIHFQSLARGIMVRYRESGLMFDQQLLPESVGRKIINHLKVLGNINIADRRRPHDGRVIYYLQERSVDLRLATVPTLYGENLTLRLFDRQSAVRQLDQLGIEAVDLHRIRNLLRSPHGLILVTGPTGAGKTTTLYACLESLNDTTRNILTVEDPIEYDVDRINQIAVQRRLGLDFAEVLRACFRHDPDVIMIGEIRDTESARIAVRAAMSGHLVFSTLHTGSALNAFTSLVQLGVSPYLVASALLGVVTQQLVRRICPQCTERFEFPLEGMAPLQRREFESAVETAGSPSFAVGTGCEHCRQTGFMGRCGLFEVLEVNSAIREALAEGQSRLRLEQLARANGWRSLQLAGFCKIVRGETTIEEVLRVAPIADDSMRAESSVHGPRLLTSESVT